MATVDESRPRIAVLLATHNGIRFIGEQVDSILGQHGVDVRVIALDDASSDGTVEWLAERAAADPRLTVLPSQGRAGSAAANFYRLVHSAKTADGELISFADQDDLWMPDKLSRHAELLAAGGHDGVSSNVTSFTAAGHRSLVRKAFPQRDYDYLLESPGPGSTFLVTRRLIDLTREVLDTIPAATEVEYHDSLIYAIARGHGWSWHIDDYSSVDYRQHDANVMGSNVGVGSALERLRLIRTHWLRAHSTRLTRVALGVAPPEKRAALERILALMTGRGIRTRLALARLTPKLRRRPRDQRIIGLLIAIGVW
ncbi:glycosyltransferase family 2 protein [soil metagenome]